MKSLIRVASGQGFWGDLRRAPMDQVSKGPVDYLVMDFLAEVTMSIMQKQRKRDPAAGYALDLVDILAEILPTCMERGIRVITNGGGVNPEGCREALFRWARARGFRGLRVGVVTGDDILHRLDGLAHRGIGLENMETGEALEGVRGRLLSANVYFGAGPVVSALAEGAHVVITGRMTDTGLTLAPMMHEFGWKAADTDLLAAGTVAGHILECGAQASGGNFSADWRSVPDPARIGFPIAEAYPDGQVVITKHEGTGGRVSMQTVKEQLLYEIGDPASYITPDCIADFTTIRLGEDGPDRVRVSGVGGRPAPASYKVSMSYRDGYLAVGSLTYAWPDALEKARRADAILRARLDALDLRFEEIRTEFLGYDSCHGPLSSSAPEPDEVVLRVGVRGEDRASVERFAMEIAPLILTGPPGVTGFGGGRPKPSEVVAFWPALIPKEAVSPQVAVEEVSA
ncbi:MAG: acyclic terpene utilization AtuA family protein [Bacteroidota bacterium]